MSKIIKGRDIKDIVSKIPDNALVVIGTENDKLGKNDVQISSLEIRSIGFDNDDIYYALCTKPFSNTGCLKFYK